jgi:S-adenosylmethionine hydrolase
MAIMLFTDFGSHDLYLGQVKAMLAREAPHAPAIDLLNDVSPFGIKAAAHLLASLVLQCPQGSVFLAVVDPGVGGQREPVVLRADGYRFVGPDNGLLSVFAARAAHPEVFKIVWRPERLSASFHGRDLFAPVAAQVAMDNVPEGWLLRVPGLSVDLGAGELPEIIHIDHYGNAMTGIRGSAVRRDAELVINGHRLRYARVFSAVARGDAFWYENSQGLVEVAVNQGSAAENLKLSVGMPIQWKT